MDSTGDDAAGSAPSGGTASTGATADDTTLDVPPVEVGARYVLGRRVATGLLTVLVLLGAANVFGVRTGTASASADGWTVTVRYPQMARAGLDATLAVRVTSTDGFGSEIHLALDAAYFEVYESQRFFPEPSSESRDGRWWHLTFDAPPEGTTFEASYDAYLQPSSQIGRTGAAVLLVDGEPVVEVPFRTTLMP